MFIFNYAIILYIDFRYDAIMFNFIAQHEYVS